MSDFLVPSERETGSEGRRRERAWVRSIDHDFEEKEGVMARKFEFCFDSRSSDKTNRTGQGHIKHQEENRQARKQEASSVVLPRR
jgi:hypothetical protein